MINIIKAIENQRNASLNAVKPRHKKQLFHCLEKSAVILKVLKKGLGNRLIVHT